MISLIFASDKRGVIGVDGKLPWYIPQDLEYFKQKTLDKTMIMGRKTFESLGGPLFRRDHLVLSNDSQLQEEYNKFDRTWVYDFDKIKYIIDKYPEKDFFIIGGTEVFKAFMPYADKIYRTLIDHKFVGDTFFRPNLNGWICTDYYKGIKDEKNPYDYYFETWERNR